MDRTQVGVAGDIMPGHGGDDVGPTAFLQRTGLFADDEKRARHSLVAHYLGQPLGNLIDRLLCGRDVILHVKTDHDIRLVLRCAAGLEAENAQDQTQEDSENL